MSTLTDSKSRLESWKEIAAYLHRSERTVMRWETERRLPVRRVSGLDKSRVYAEIAELEAWRRGDPPPVEAAQPREIAAKSTPSETVTAAPLPGPAPAPLKKRRRPGTTVVAALVIATLIALLAAARLLYATRYAVTVPPPLAAQRFYLAGMDDWATRTPASLNRAVAEFEAAITSDPGYAGAYAGLAACYDLLREYTLMPASQAYPLAKAAAERALALDDRLSGAHAALAFAEFYGSWDVSDARREFRRAVDLDPKNETAHQWRATFLMVEGDETGAMREIDAAQMLNPTSLAIAADRDFILAAAGHKAEAVAGLRAIEGAHPNFLSPHNYLASLYLADGDDADYLLESGIAAGLMQDRPRQALIAAARAGFIAGGHTGMLTALGREQTDQFQSGATSAYSVADTWAMLGDRTKALAYLRLAIERRDADAVAIGIDHAFAPLRADPQFQRLRRRVLAA